ncbi:MAG: SDR family oxidoreductase [Pseudomonadota bacterium]
MKVIVFGATGTVGKLVVERAIDAGHTVSAFARGPEKLNWDHPRLAKLAGDVMDQAAVSDAVAGHDAVIVVLGAGMSRKSKVRSVGTANIVAAMKSNGVRRLICQSTLGAHESWGNLNFYWKRIMFGALLRPVFLDHQVQEDIVRGSGLDWTIVRPSALTDEPATGAYRVGFDVNERKLTLKISRADVADFIQRELQHRDFVGRAVAVSF